MEYWVIIRVGEKPKGPYEVDEVLNLPLSPESLIWHSGMEEWQAATTFDEFKSVFEGDPEEAEAPVEANEAEATAEPVVAEENPVEAEPVAEESEAEAAAIAEEAAPEAKAEEGVESEKAEPTPPPVPPAYAVPPVPQAAPYAPYQQQPVYPQQAANVPPQTPVPECPPTNLVWSILFTILCCAPFGIVGIIFAILTKTRYNKGNYKGAQKASEIAEWMCILSFTFGLVFWPIRLFTL